MAKRTTKKEASESAISEPKKENKKSRSKKATPIEPEKKSKKASTKKAAPAEVKKPMGAKKEELNKPSLRSIYSNSKNTLMPLGFGSDFRTKKCVVIFSDLFTGQVHTTALAVWNRLKLKEVKEINPQT